MSAMEMDLGWCDRRKVWTVWVSTEDGMGFTRDGGGSILL
jgi:hypothetical protein